MKIKSLAVFAVLLFILPMAFAEENGLNEEIAIDEELDYEMPVMINEEVVDLNGEIEEEIELIEPGILPDSPFYGLGRAIERVQMALTFNENRKAEFGLQLAEKRLSEARTMLQRNKEEYVDGLMEEYTQNMEQVRQRVERRIEDCENLESEECRKILQLNEKVQESTTRHLNALQGVLEKVPEQAREAIQHAMNVSAREQVEIMQRLENRFREMQQEEFENAIGAPEFNDELPASIPAPVPGRQDGRP